MRLACGHVIGSECLERVASSGSAAGSRCPYCRATIATTSPLPRTIQWLTNTTWARASFKLGLLFGGILADATILRLLENKPRYWLLAFHRPIDQVNLDRLTNHLFARKLTTRSATMLWLHINKLVAITHFLLCASFMLLLCIPGQILDWVGGTYIELVIVWVLPGSSHYSSFGATTSFILAIFTNVVLGAVFYVVERISNAQLPLIFWMFVGWRTLEFVFSLKVLMLVYLLQIALMAAFTAILISYGVRGQVR